MFLDKAGQDAFEFEKVNDLDAWRDYRPDGSSETLKVSTTGTISATYVTPAE